MMLKSPDQIKLTLSERELRILISAVEEFSETVGHLMPVYRDLQHKLEQRMAEFQNCK